MEENKKFKLVSSKRTRYLLPNILTLAGVCLGISSIKFSIDGNFSLAVNLILFAAILDALDGRIARLIKGKLERSQFKCVSAYCLSSAVASEIATLPWRQVHVAQSPTLPAFLKLFAQSGELGGGDGERSQE